MFGCGSGRRSDLTNEKWYVFVTFCLAQICEMDPQEQHPFVLQPLHLERDGIFAPILLYSQQYDDSEFSMRFIEEVGGQGFDKVE